MTHKEKIDDILLLVEANAQDVNGYSAAEILNRVALRIGISTRSANETFSYIIGAPFLGYIKERKMMNAAKILMSGNTFALDSAITISGYDNQNSFGKAFKERFGMTPKKFQEKNDLSMITPAMTASALDRNANVVLNENSEGEKRFGIPFLQLEKAKMALRLQEYYELPDNIANLAFDIGEDWQEDMYPEGKDVNWMAFAFGETSDVYHAFVKSEKELGSELMNDFFADTDLIQVCSDFDLFNKILDTKSGFDMIPYLYDLFKKSNEPSFYELLQKYQYELDSSGKTDPKTGYVNSDFDWHEGFNVFSNVILGE